MSSSIFRSPRLFEHLRTLQLSIREDILAGDELYAFDGAAEHADSLTGCLLSAPNLKSLDLEVYTLGEHVFNSPFLAHLPRQTMPFRLESLTLEYNNQSEAILTELVRPHASTVKRLLLLNSNIQPGTWSGWLEGMKEAGMMLDYLEIWKPSQNGKEHVNGREDSKWFTLSTVSGIAREGKVVPFLPEEQWQNCYPRIDRR
jgi:hypothetical protein